MQIREPMEKPSKPKSMWPSQAPPQARLSEQLDGLIRIPTLVLDRKPLGGVRRKRSLERKSNEASQGRIAG